MPGARWAMPMALPPTEPHRAPLALWSAMATVEAEVVESVPSATMNRTASLPSRLMAPTPRLLSGVPCSSM